jgi:hypothetical protein
LCKEETTKEQHLDWFLKLLISVIAKDVASTFPQTEEESINKAQQFDLIYAQSGYLYTMLPDAPRTIPFSQEKHGMSHTANGFIGFVMHQQPYNQPKPIYGKPQYLQPYGGTSYYHPPTYQKPYPVSPPPPMDGPSPVPMMCPTSQPISVSPSTSAYNLGTSESASPSYAPYGSFPKNNPYFLFLGPPQSVSSPPGHPHVGINFVHPSPIQQI